MPATPTRLRVVLQSAEEAARVAKLADARDLKSRAPKGAWRFDSAPGHQHSVTPTHEPAVSRSFAEKQ